MRKIIYISKINAVGPCASPGNIVEAVRHMRKVQSQIKELTVMNNEELMAISKLMGAPFSLVQQIKQLKKLPVPNFAAGGIATPADASLMMQLGAEGVFVGSGIFKSAADIDDDNKRLAQQKAMATAIVKAVTYFDDPKILAEVSAEVPQTAMRGLSVAQLLPDELMAGRGS